MILYLPYLPFGFDGIALKWIVLIKKGQEKILAHEMVHVRQQKQIGLVKYLFKYLTNSDFRVAIEYEAYRKGSFMSIEQAEHMAERYRTTLFPFR